VVSDVIPRHLRACGEFSGVVEAAGDRWALPTPCGEWDVRQVVEHVIGFHDILLLRPLGTKPDRPRDDPVTRWAVTVPAIALALRDVGDALVVAVPGDTFMDLGLLLPMLTGDVLIHTWDLATAIGVPTPFDTELWANAYEAALVNDSALRASDMFGPPVPVPDEADVVTKLVALSGRDPGWRAP